MRSAYVKREVKGCRLPREADVGEHGAAQADAEGGECRGGETALLEAQVRSQSHRAQLLCEAYAGLEGYFHPTALQSCNSHHFFLAVNLHFC